MTSFQIFRGMSARRWKKLGGLGISMNAAATRFAFSTVLVTASSALTFDSAGAASVVNLVSRGVSFCAICNLAAASANSLPKRVSSAAEASALSDDAKGAGTTTVNDEVGAGAIGREMTALVDSG